jgi:hypothetical protein
MRFGQRGSGLPSRYLWVLPRDERLSINSQGSKVGSQGNLDTVIQRHLFISALTVQY